MIHLCFSWEHKVRTWLDIGEAVLGPVPGQVRVRGGEIRQQFGKLLQEMDSVSFQELNCRSS